jgi:hypothetical protein
MVMSFNRSIELTIGFLTFFKFQTLQEEIVKNKEMSYFTQWVGEG